MYKMKNTLKCISNWLDTAQEKISELEDWAIETTQNVTWREKKREIRVEKKYIQAIRVFKREKIEVRLKKTFAWKFSILVQKLWQPMKPHLRPGYAICHQSNLGYIIHLLWALLVSQRKQYLASRVTCRRCCQQGAWCIRTWHTACSWYY